MAHSPLQALSRLRIGAKFFLVLSAVIPMVLALAAVALVGLGRANDATDQIYGQNLRVTALTGELEAHLDDAAESALQIIPTDSPVVRRRLIRELDGQTVPQVNRAIVELRSARSGDSASDRRRVEQIASGWRSFLRFEASGALENAAKTNAGSLRSDALASRVAGIFDPTTGLARRLAETEVARARRARERAANHYTSSRLLLGAAIFGTLLGCAGVLLWLIRDVVPRLREYSEFASRVAAGELDSRLEPRGSDELAGLGLTLNHMVGRRQKESAYEDAEREYTETMQLTESEDEAHDLLKRHVERSIPESQVVVLNRNNSADRLEATTPLPDDSELGEGLTGAVPRSCLAVRFARTHEESPGRPALLHCQVCGRTAGPSTCEPLIVSGEVIGSVLVEHPRSLEPQEGARVGSSVAHAGPVLGNLRNLALAEFRAATDSLTGLPNKRAAKDTLKRMVAQASRTGTPLTLALLDLDHFKQINDTYGHGKGDEVLAAVGAALDGSVREGDFVGRYGGEEFQILLPDTDREGAAMAGEKMRSAIDGIRIQGVDRPITASIGFAVLPADAGDADTLSRQADRALYSAKAQGRNRIVAFSVGEDPGSGAKVVPVGGTEAVR